MADPTESVLEFIRQLPHSATELDKADGPWLIRRILDPQMGERLSFKVQLLSRVHRLFLFVFPVSRQFRKWSYAWVRLCC